MCKLCQTKPVYEFTNKRKLCKNCFIHWFNKKVLYTIRKFELIKKGDVIGYENFGDFRSVVLESVLKMFSEKTTIELFKLPTKRKINKIAIPSTADLQANKIVHALIKNEKLNSKKKIIKPLLLFLDKEVLLYAKLRSDFVFGEAESKANYAKLKKLKFKKTKDKQDKISIFLDDMEKKHPEVKRAVLNSYIYR